MSGKTVQLHLDQEVLDMLDRLQSATGARSLIEVFRDALGVYFALHAMRSEYPGKVLALVDHVAGEMQELHIPTLTPGEPG